MDEKDSVVKLLSEQVVSDHLMSIAEVASYLNMKHSTLYSYVERKQIPHIRIGKLIRFKRQQIDFWLVELTVQPNEPGQIREGYLGFKKSRREINGIVERAIAESRKVNYTGKRGKQPAASGKEE